MGALQGEFVLVAGEVNPIMQSLRRDDGEAIALHNHELDEQPRLFYMHTWARGDAVTLAHTVRSALDRTNSA